MPHSQSADATVRQHFRHAMAQMASSVHILTTDGNAGRCGITVTAVCPVSDTPPTLLVCINRSSAMNTVFRENGIACLNMLAGDQETQARLFAGMEPVAPMAERFDHKHWHSDPQHAVAPSLHHALAIVHGAITRAEEVGTHTVFFIEATHFGVERHTDSLVYFRRGFNRLG